ncbi:MAG: ABC transporter permease [Candidatus Thorarchaeota archaeon]|nr:ABC transporter permease [Candidatus Thorarchaeota archaeon]
MFKYAFKRVLRGYRLFIALTLGVLIASTFFASMLMAADIQSQKALTLALEDIDYDARMVARDTTWNLTQYDEIEQLVEEMPEVNALDRYTKFSFNYNASAGQSFDVYGLEETSTIWNSLSFLNGSGILQENETLVVASSVNASLLSIGQVVTVPVRYFTSDSPFPQSINVNLTVAGFCDISEQTAQLLNPQQTINLGFIEIPIGDWREYDLMLVNWGETVEPILDWYLQKENATALAATTGYLVQLDRAYLINPYDIGASSSNIQDALSKIEDRTAIYNAKTTNLVGTTLTILSFTSTVLVLAYVSLAAPVIFMAWYSSTMLSDVSYNLRRREFGLLQTKGFGPKAIKSMLRLESFIIGIIGGTLGLFAGTYIAHIIGDVAIESAFTSILSNPINVIFTIGFGVVLSYWSIRGPSDRASKLDPLDALKQYIYVEEQREYKRLLPIIAFALGSYKLIVWMLGIDMNVLLGSALSTNFILLIVVALWTPVDGLLNVVGPIAFLYGTTKILLRGSQRFQLGVVQAGKRFF